MNVKKQIETYLYNGIQLHNDDFLIILSSRLFNKLEGETWLKYYDNIPVLEGSTKTPIEYRRGTEDEWRHIRIKLMVDKYLE